MKITIDLNDEILTAWAKFQEYRTDRTVNLNELVRMIMDGEALDGVFVWVSQAASFPAMKSELRSAKRLVKLFEADYAALGV